MQSKDKLKKARGELYEFLEQKSSYDASELSSEVQKHTWMDEEIILLLVKEKNFDLAIEKYISQGKFGDAEKFCTMHAHRQKGLLTKLLEKYYAKYNELRDSIDLKANEEAKQYERRAIRLMQENTSTDLLDPETILEQIPDHWELKTADCDLISYLAALFDQQMTKEENAKIAENLA